MSVLGPALLLAVGLVLAAAGVAHLRDPRSLGDAVRLHRVLPTRLVPPRALGLLELVVGLALVGSALTGAVTGGRVAGIAAALLLAAMTGYLARARVLQARSDAGDLPCGCGIAEAPLGPWVVARGAGLTTAAALGALTASSWAIAQRPAAEVVVALAAGLTLALVLALLPAARAVPAAATVAGGVAGSAR